MAWIERHSSGSGYKVRWREDGRLRSEYAATRGQAEQAKARIEGHPEATDLEATMPAVPVLPDGTMGLLTISNLFGRGKPAVSQYARTILGADSTLRDSTRSQYEYTLKTHIDQTPLGKAPLDRVTPDMVREFFTSSRAGKGARRNIHKTLARTFNAAVREGVIESSPLFRAGIRKPNGDRLRELQPLTVQQVESVAAAALTKRETSKYISSTSFGPKLAPSAVRLCIRVMAYGGLRIGEVAALRPSDINGHGLRINRSMNARGQVVEPKTPAGRRTAPLPESVLSELAAYCSEQGLGEGDLIFSVQTQTIARAVRNAGKLAGVRVNPHLLRHSAASLWIDAGASAREVQTALGHANVKVTLDLYTHLFDQNNPRLAESMQRRLDALSA